MKKIILFCFSITLTYLLSGQCAHSPSLQLQSSIAVASPLLQHDMTARRDSSALKPYLYVAGKEQGLKIYNISTIASPVLTASVVITSLGNLHVMSLTQLGNYLYLALGDHFNASAQKSGLAIIDVSTPSSPIVKSVYSYSLNSGAGSVAVEGNYAYLSAMQNGILVFDVSNKSSIALVSAFKPSVNFPKASPSASDLQKINVRQITAKNNILYVCYDAGGVRIVNATNKTSLKETGKYSNPLLDTRPRAYNNLVLNDSLVYVAADYCGMEILNVKDTAHITKIGWWNPWNCQSASNTWFNSPGHANEIEYDPNCKMIFLSTGRSDMHVVNVSNPTLPDSCARFGNSIDSLGSWGLGRYNNQIYLAYIPTWPLYVPFPGNWGGTKIITYDNACVTAIKKLSLEEIPLIYPNPTHHEIYIELPSFTEATEITIYNALGQSIKNERVSDKQTKIDLSKYDNGLYQIKISNGENYKVYKVMKE